MKPQSDDRQKMPLTPINYRLAAIAICLLMAGCQTHRNLVEQAHSHYWKGNFEQSAEVLTQAIDRPKNDVDVLKLDQAMIEFQRGNLKESQALLREVRDSFDSPAVGKAARDTLSLLTDDGTRMYVAEDHEKVLLRVMLAFSSLLQNDGDTVPFAHQIGEQCERLLASRPKVIDADVARDAKAKAKSPTGAAVAKNSEAPTTEQGPLGDNAVATVSFVESTDATKTIVKPDLIRRELAVAPLLRAIIRGQSLMNQDDQIRNLQMANEWRPDSPFLQQEYARATNGGQPPPGYGSVYVFALVGRGPQKVESTERVSSTALLVADQVLSATGKYTLPPTIAPIKVARIKLSLISVDSLLVDVDGNSLGSTETIADIGRMAVEIQNEQMPQIIGRAVARRVAKKGLVVAGKAAADAFKESGNDLTSLAYSVAGVIWEATEQADLRAWTLLPGSIQVIRVDVPVGSHQLTLRPSCYGRSVGKSFSVPLTIQDGQTTFALASLPDARSQGQIFVPER